MLDDPVLLDQLLESLPVLPPCDVVDPADDQTLPRLIEVLERRNQIRRMMIGQIDKSGTGIFYTSQIISHIYC